MAPKLIILCGFCALACFIQLADAYYYFGCNKDIIGGQRALTHYYGVVSSVKECVQKCPFRKFKYAGIRNGKECYCGKHAKNGWEDCNMKCKKGGAYTECGDKNAMTIYGGI